VGGWKGLKELRNSGKRVRADERILGGSEFVERVLRESEEEWERRSLLRKKGMNLRWLLKKVAGHFGVDTESLESGSKVPTIAKARAVRCYLGVREAPRAAARDILTSSAEPAEADPPSPTAAAEAMAVKRLRRIPFSHSSPPFRTGLSAKAGKIGLTSVSISTELGISQSAVSRAIARAPEILQREEINGEWLEYQ
jgi:hypothetical protein